jgi:DNA-binding GntR family transcriptional regulator
MSNDLDQQVYVAIRDAGQPVRVSELDARFCDSRGVRIWQILSRLEARDLIHITAAGEPFVSLPKAAPARQLTLGEGTPA